MTICKMHLKYVLLFLCLSIGYLSLDANAADVVEYAPIVQLNSGKVRGIVQEANEHKVHLYQGIRYGTAQRFAKPKPAQPWTGVYNATTYRDACVQCGFTGRIAWLLNYTQTESDDCLFLNIWLPSQPSPKANRTVMVWIYGGSFQMGTIFTPLFDGRWLAAQGDVVLVSVNYRLGPFGFLFTGSEDAPGNAGLHDQILALKWIQENIAQFGGDSMSVTLFGESAGSMSVGALILSPLTRGLFTRAIMQSGAPNRLVASSRSESLAKTHKFAQKLNCPIESHESLISCLRSKSTDQLANATVNAFALNELFSLVYGDELLPNAPVDAVKSQNVTRNVDLMYGLTSNEGSGFVGALVQQITSNKTEFTVDLLKGLIPPFMRQYGNEVNWTEVTEFYVDKLPRQPTQEDFKTTLANILGDYTLVCPAILFAEQLSLASPNSTHYAYRLMKNARMVNQSTLPSWMGVPHAGDLNYLFSIPLLDGEESVRLSVDMIRAWTNFAKYGHPGKMEKVEWTQTMVTGQSQTTEHMNLDLTNYRMVKGYYTEICNSYWKPKLFGSDSKSNGTTQRHGL